MDPKMDELFMNDFEVDRIWFHIRHEHKEWAEFVALHSHEVSFGSVRSLLLSECWKDHEVEKRPLTFEGLKNTMNELIDLAHHLQLRGLRTPYEQLYFCRV